MILVKNIMNDVNKLNNTIISKPNVAEAEKIALSLDSSRETLVNSLTNKGFTKNQINQLNLPDIKVGTDVLETYKAEVANLIEQRDLAKKEMLHQNKLLKRQKRKTVIGILGTAGLGVAAFIFLK